jgi:acetoin utilization protein AcuB
MDRTPIGSPAALTQIRARDVMTRSPLGVTPDTRLSRVTELMHQRGIQNFPVVDGERLVGMLTEKALHDAMPSMLTVADPAARERALALTQVAQVAEKGPHTVTPDSPMTRVIQVMRTYRLGALAVVEGGRLVGIITSGDLITLLERILQGAEKWSLAPAPAAAAR